MPRDSLAEHCFTCLFLHSFCARFIKKRTSVDEVLFVGLRAFNWRLVLAADDDVAFEFEDAGFDVEAVFVVV